MQKSFLYQKSFRSYLIPILLLIGSFSIYSYNLEGQSFHGDEILYLAWGGPYFDVVKDGDFDNPCLKGLADCEFLFDPDWEGHNINYTPVRNFLVGSSTTNTEKMNKLVNKTNDANSENMRFLVFIFFMR